MITKNIFNQSITPSINELSPIYNHKYSPLTYNESIKFSKDRNTLSQEKHKYSNQKNNPSAEKPNNSNQKYSSRLDSQNEMNQKYGILSRENVDERNSLLLRSYDKYDHISDGLRRDRIVEESQNDSQNSPVFHTNLSSLEKPYLLEHRSPQLTQKKPLALSSLPSQFELLLQYELKRQKQKNEILQKRLNNKQDFIEEMKRIQQDLTIAYAKCQEELNFSNTVIYEMQTKGNKEIRDYKQEIQELKHQVHILQREIHEKELKKAKPSSSKKSLSHIHHIETGKNLAQDGKEYVKSKSSVNLTRHKSITEANLKNPPIMSRRPSNSNSHFKDINVNKKSLIIEGNHVNSNSIEQDKQNNQNGILHEHTQSIVSNTNKRQSSLINKALGMNKNLTNQPLNSQFSSISQSFKQESNLLNTFKPLQAIPSQISQFQAQILSNLLKVSKFLHHFIYMCDKMQQIDQTPEIEHTKENHKGRLILKLKKYWKWIKDVIKEWKELKGQKNLHKKDTKQFGGISNLSNKLKDETYGYETEDKHKNSDLGSINPSTSPQKLEKLKLNEDKHLKEDDDQLSKVRLIK